MRDKGRIVLGLLVFLALITFPVWYNQVIGKQAPPPEPKLPADGSRCVADADFMRTDHMQLLVSWRDEVVRDNLRIFSTEDGRRYHKSLTGTCMSCHREKQEFCDKCHDYVGVEAYCWDCHLEPKGEQ